MGNRTAAPPPNVSIAAADKADASGNIVSCAATPMTVGELRQQFETIETVPEW